MADKENNEERKNPIGKAFEMNPELTKLMEGLPKRSFAVPHSVQDSVTKSQELVDKLQFQQISISSKW